MKCEHEDLIGQRYTFEDGDWLEVLQIKWRDEDTFLITYYIQQGPGIPRKLVSTLQEFLDKYGYLFGKGTIPEQP